MIKLFYSVSEYEASKPIYLQITLPRKTNILYANKDSVILNMNVERMTMFEDILKKRTWFGGNVLSYVDFIVYELIDENRIFQPDCLQLYPKVQEFLKRIQNLPTLSAYLHSDEHTTGAINNKMAAFY